MAAGAIIHLVLLGYTRRLSHIETVIPIFGGMTVFIGNQPGLVPRRVNGGGRFLAGNYPPGPGQRAADWAGR